MNKAIDTNDFMIDSQGRLVPINLVKPIDRQRHEVVEEIVKKAVELQAALKAFKDQCLGDMQAFIELSAEEYGAKLGGQKGNVSLVSFDGKHKVQRSIAEYLTFDERLQVAKELIDNCINRWAQDAGSEIRILVQDAFQTDKEGKISTTRVLGLRRLDIKDSEWQQAMQAISDSVQVTGSKTYFRVYERVGDTDQWKPIPLDVAAV
jgi:hypothetical protein